MVDTVLKQGSSLRILHVLRAPLGGLFRHVVDLTREQIARGHAVGWVVDSLAGGDAERKILAELEPALALGLLRIPIRRHPHLSDVTAFLKILKHVHTTAPQIVHGHGSKGGVLARLTGFVPTFGAPFRAYTPHGGSLNYRPGTRMHAFYMKVEAAMQRHTDMVLFESVFIARRYEAFVGRAPPFSKVIHNGIGASEFEAVLPNSDASDFLYVGELRAAKGIDTLLDALACTAQSLGTVPSLTLVGSGPDRAMLEAQAAALDLEKRVTFRNPLPARQAFTLGRSLVVPSRAESLPYVVLEAAGARVPMIATSVGGIPEIFGPLRHRLIPTDDVSALSDRLIEALVGSNTARIQEADALAKFVQDRFSIGRMVDNVLASYRDLLAGRGSLVPVDPQAPVVLSS